MKSISIAAFTILSAGTLSLPLNLQETAMQEGSLLNNIAEFTHHAAASVSAGRWMNSLFSSKDDDFAIVKKWAEMGASRAKDELKEKLMMNPILKDLFQIELTRNNLNRAISEGNLSLIKFFKAMGFEPDYLDLTTAIKSGNLDIINYMVKIVEPDWFSFRLAVELGNPEIVKALIKGGGKPEPRDLVFAIFYGKVETVEALINGGASDARLMNEIRKGKLNMLETMIKRGIKPDPSSLFYAMRLGKHDIVNALIEAEVADRKHLTFAILLGQLEIVNDLIERGLAESGHLQIAIQIGNLDIVKALIKSGVADKLNLSYAIELGNLEMVKTLIKDGKVIPDGHHLVIAKLSDKIEIVKYLNDLGVSIDPNTLSVATKSGNLDLIKELIAKVGLIPNQVTLNEAIKSRNLNLVKYLVEERRLFPVFQNFYEAAMSQNPQLVAYFEDLAQHDKAYIGFYGSPSA